MRTEGVTHGIWGFRRGDDGTISPLVFFSFLMRKSGGCTHNLACYSAGVSLFCLS